MKIRILIVIAVILTGYFYSTRAQTIVDSVKENWVTRWRILAGVEWSDNVYKLSSSQQSRMNLNDPGDSVSGRYEDMQSMSDVILSIAPEFQIRMKNGLFKRSFSLSGIVDYKHYIHNTKKDFVKLGLVVRQKTSKRGRIIVEADYTPSCFSKNYLVDATDSTGKVSSSERIYNEGVYDEWEFILAYERWIKKWIVDIQGNLFLGYRNRRFNDQFIGRNQNAFGGGLGFEIGLNQWWLLFLEYYFESIQSPISSEVMILDEPDYQIDFNNDRDFADNNRRTVQTVNRSRHSQTLDFITEFIPFERLNLYVGLKFIFKNYLSQEPIDPNYKDRNDTKRTFRFGLVYQLYESLFFMTEYKNVIQQTNRPDDPEYVGEETDYKTNIIKAGIQWQF